MLAQGLRNTGEIEQLRLAQIKGLVKVEHITAKQWDKIQENDKLYYESS